MFTEGKTSEIKHQNVDVSLDKEKYACEAKRREFAK